MWQQLRRDADTRVDDRQAQILELVFIGALELCHDADRPTRFGELHGVVQQVGDDLDEARRIDLEHAQLRRQFDAQLDPLCANRRTVRLDRAVHQRIQRCGLGVELHLAGGDPRDVEQIIDQSNHVPDLPFHHRSDLLD